MYFSSVVFEKQDFSRLDLADLLLLMLFLCPLPLRLGVLS